MPSESTIRQGLRSIDIAVLDQRLAGLAQSLESGSTLFDYVDWPSVGQVIRRPYERIELETGEVSRATTYGIISLPRTQASASDVDRSLTLIGAAEI